MKLPLPFHKLESNRMARFDSHFDLAGHAAYTLRWNAFRVKGQYPLTWANPLPQCGVEGPNDIFALRRKGF
jgi:hypothetical protein